MIAPRETPDAIEAALGAALAPRLLLLRLLGEGGMGKVFLARDPALRRSVAVKVLSPQLASDPEARARFEREAQSVAALSHPNVLAVYSVGELADATPYFVMPYVEGESLADRLRSQGPMAVPDAQRLLGQVASALAAAHAKGIIHRDIKPANILIEQESGRALVADFGIAAVLPRGGEPDVRLTQTGLAIGTPQYMSPEQLVQERVTDRTDVYAFGLLAWELLVGTPTFQASTPGGLVAAHLRDVPRPLNEVRKDVDVELATLVARCLEKAPDARPTAAEIAARLAPGGAVLLEWPPPGLGALHGGLNAILRPLWWGTALSASVIAVLLYAGPLVSGVLLSVEGTLLFGFGLTGACLVVLAMARAIGVLRRAAASARAGYAWGTLLEVSADTGGDGGTLIAGTSRFAALTAVHRDRLRRNRLRAAGVLIAAVLIAPILAVFALVLGSVGALGTGGTWGAPASVLLALAAVLVLRWQESRAAAPRTRPRTDDGLGRAVVDAWYATFEQARSGQSLGRGGALRPAAWWLALVPAAAVTALGVVTLVIVVLAGTVGPLLWNTYVPVFSRIRASLADVAAVREWALAPDDRVSAIDAGTAYYQLFAQRDKQSASHPERDVPMLPARPWGEPPLGSGMPADVFPTLRLKDRKGQVSAAIIDSLRRTPSAAERAWLSDVLRHDGWRAVATVARAKHVDAIGGRFQIPFRDDASFVLMPILRIGDLLSFAFANSARIAAHLQAGRADSAVLAAREIITLGLRVQEGGHGMLDAVVGRRIAAIGREQLVRTLRVLGDARAAQIEAQYAAVVRSAEAADAAQDGAASVGRRDPRLVRAELLGIVRDSTEFAALRWEALGMLAKAPCTNAQELILGPDAELQEHFEHARRTLARSAGDSSLIDLIRTEPERFGRPPAELGSLPHRAIVATAELAGTLFANRRLTGCAKMLLWG